LNFLENGAEILNRLMAVVAIHNCIFDEVIFFCVWEGTKTGIGVVVDN